MPPRRRARGGTAKAKATQSKAAATTTRRTAQKAQTAASSSKSSKRKRDAPDTSEETPANKVARVSSDTKIEKTSKRVTKDVSQPSEVKQATEVQQTNEARQPDKVEKENHVAPDTKIAEKVQPAAKESSQEKKAEDRTKAKQTKKRSHPPPIYDEVWKEVYLAGTEWDQLQLVYSIDWEFDHLDEALTDGDLEDKKVYLFGATEPQLLMRNEKDEKGDVIPVPVIVAVVTDVPPPSTVGLKSVQREQEEIVAMSTLRMGWHAYAPENVSHSRRFKPKVHVLKCNERRARLKNMENAAVHKYDYVLPYFFNPEQVEDVTVDTNVQVLAELEGQKAPLMCEFDYEMDELDEFVEETLKENDLDASKHTESLKKAIREAVRATKLKYKAEKEERQKRIESISPEEREAMKNMKLLKFYPQNEWPDVSKIKAPFINRYYGRATEVL